MNTDVGSPRARLEPDLRSRRAGDRDLRVGTRHLRRCDRDECVRDRVRAGIAALQMSLPLVVRNRPCVVFMRRQAVVVLWMTVIVVRVAVERGHGPRGREERGDQQQRQ